MSLIAIKSARAPGAPHALKSSAAGAMRLACALGSAVFCLLLIWAAGRVTLSKAHYRNQPVDYPLWKADEAVRLNPLDADARQTRAVMLLDAGKFAESVAEYEACVSLRPADHHLWLDLGYARVQNGDDAGALTAYSRASRLAPRYAEPHMRLGEFLLRTGRREDAFAEFRAAAAYDPSLLSEIFESAWGEYRGDAKAALLAVRPQSQSARLVVARKLIAEGRAGEAMELFGGGLLPEAVRQSLLGELLGAKRFAEAYKVWSSIGGEFREKEAGRYFVFHDGGFEQEVSAEEEGFGWRGARSTETLNVTRDPGEHQSSDYSLRLSFNGNSAPAAEAVSQLLLVEPRNHYRLGFAAKTQNLVTGGLPFIEVADATDGKVLGRSATLPPNSAEWQGFSVDLTTADTTRAVRVVLRRQSCARSPCPAFGVVWLDSFHGEVVKKK